MAVDEAWLNRQLEDMNRALRELPPSVAASFAPVMANLQATIIATIQATYSTTAQMNTAIAHPGAINPTTVNSGSQTVTGDINLSGDLYTPHGRATPVTSNYVAAYLNNDGRLGATASSAAVKVDLAAMDAADAAKLLAVTPYWGRYMWDDPDSPMKAFLLAEDVQAAGFGPDIAPVVDGDTAMNIGTEEQPVLMQPGQAWTINEAKLVPSLLAIVRMQQAQIDALTSRLDAAGL